jgi:hypothetical protein
MSERPAPALAACDARSAPLERPPAHPCWRLPRNFLAHRCPLLCSTGSAPQPTRSVEHVLIDHILNLIVVLTAITVIDSDHSIVTNRKVGHNGPLFGRRPGLPGVSGEGRGGYSRCRARPSYVGMARQISLDHRSHVTGPNFSGMHIVADCDRDFRTFPVAQATKLDTYASHIRSATESSRRQASPCCGNPSPGRRWRG